MLSFKVLSLQKAFPEQKYGKDNKTTNNIYIRLIIEEKEMYSEAFPNPDESEFNNIKIWFPILIPKSVVLDGDITVVLSEKVK